MKMILAVFTMAVGLMAQTAETRILRAVLSTANEVPPITDVNASGAATVNVHVVRDSAGAIISGSVDFEVNYAFPGEATIVGLHIHRGAAGVNGPVTINTGISATASVAANGRGAISRQAQVLADDKNGLDTLAGLFSDPSGYYVNMHTSVNPGGVIRGQLQRPPTTLVMGLMSPANENPPIPDLAASGAAAISAKYTMGPNGRMTSAEVIFDVVCNFPSQVTITGLHIHSGGPTVNGPVIINTGIGAGPASVQTDANGRCNIRRRVEVPVENPVAVQTVLGLFNNPGDYYVNLHTVEFPGGVIRSQLRNADQMDFNLTLLPSNEVPAVTGLDASAPAQVRVRTLRDADGAVIAAHVRFDVNHRFPGRTDINGLHIHNGLAGDNGPVRVDSGLSRLNNRITETGFGNLFERATVYDTEGLAAINSLVMNPERHYLNLHTAVNTGGAIRAQIAAPVTAAPAITATFNSAGGRSLNTAAPGSLLSIAGTALSKVTTGLGGVSGNLPTTLNGTRVAIGGVRAPLLYVSPTQINVQVPFELSGVQPVVVTSPNGGSVPMNVTVSPTAPALFNADGAAVATKTDFSLINASNAAAGGDLVILYSTGLGQTSPAQATGRPVPLAPFASTDTTTVTIGGQNAPVISSVAAPGFVGLYATVVRVPMGLAAGNVPTVLTIGGVASNSATLAVK